MINISQNIRNVCKKKMPIPALFLVLMVSILICCPFINIFHPTSIDNIYDVTGDSEYVEVTADTLYYSGYNLIKTGDEILLLNFESIEKVV